MTETDMSSQITNHNFCNTFFNSTSVSFKPSSQFMFDVVAIKNKECPKLIDQNLPSVLCM